MSYYTLQTAFNNVADLKFLEQLNKRATKKLQMQPADSAMLTAGWQAALSQGDSADDTGKFFLKLITLATAVTEN